MIVEQILKEKGSDVLTLNIETDLYSAIRFLRQNKIGATVIIDGKGKVAGVISERDVVRFLAEDGASALKKSVRETMTRNVITISPKDTIDNSLACMTNRRIRHLPVVNEKDELVGLVSIGDLVKYKIAATEAEAEAMKAYIATG